MLLYVYTKGILATINHNGKENIVTSEKCELNNIPSGDIYVEDLLSFDCEHGYLFGTYDAENSLSGKLIKRGMYTFHSAELIVAKDINKYLKNNPQLEGKNRAESIANAIINNSLNHLFKARKAPISVITEQVRKPLRNIKHITEYRISQIQLEEDEELFNAVKQANRGCGILSNVKKQDKIHTDIFCGDIKSDYPYHMLTREYPYGVAKKVPFTGFTSGYRYLVRVKASECWANNSTVIPLYATYALDKNICDIRNCFTDSNGKLIYINKLDCWMTDVDYLLFRKYYKCKSVDIIDCYRWSAELLPEEWRKFIYDAFERKELHNDGLAKILLNAIFGVTDSLFTTSKKDTWSYLLGTWTCSFARETQAKLVEDTHAFYSAVDSFYHDEYYNYDNYNNEVLEEMIKLGYKPVNGKVPGMVVTEEHKQMRVQGINRYVLDDTLKCSGCIVDTFPIEEFTKTAIIPKGLLIVKRDYKTHTVTKETEDYNLATIAEDINFELLL